MSKYNLYLTLPNGDEEWYTTGPENENLARCIVSLGKRGDLLVTRRTGDFVLSTIGIFLHRVVSPAFREIIIEPLLRFQTCQDPEPAEMVRME